MDKRNRLRFVGIMIYWVIMNLISILMLVGMYRYRFDMSVLYGLSFVLFISIFNLRSLHISHRRATAKGLTLIEYLFEDRLD